VAVGLGVLGFQRAQVQRVELIKQLEAQWEQLGDLPTTVNAQFEGLAQAARAQAETVRTQLADQLSELSQRLDEVLAPTRAQLTKVVPGDIPNLPDLGRQLTEASQAIEEQLEAARVQLAEFAKTVDERVQPVRAQLDEQLERLEQYLPEGTRSVVQSVRAAAATPQRLLRTAVGLD
jgi:ElaB/YqjD/DUF883 family membrane-anchored ribosome-binding protein